MQLFKHFSFFTLFSLFLISTLALSTPVLAKEDKKDKKDKIKVKVLQNSENNDCLYIGDVLLRVKYKLRSQDTARIVVEVTHDNMTYHEANGIDIERGKDTTIIGFDAGECIADMRVVIK
jgi:hypothetical protein